MVRDAGSERVTRGAVMIDVCPPQLARSVGELVNAPLVKLDPAGSARIHARTHEQIGGSRHEDGHESLHEAQD
jgi:hypothetical protein